MSEPIPDYIPPEWVGETGQFLLRSTWEKLREVRARFGIDRIEYIIVPAQVYDMLIRQLEDDGRWLCPDGYMITILTDDTWPTS